MDADSIIGLKLLEVIGEYNNQLKNFDIQLTKRPEVLSTIIQIDCVKFPVTGALLSFYLDAELKNGNAISFFLGLDCNEEEWVVSTHISINDDKGYDLIKDFPERKTKIFSELLAHLASASSELLDSSTIDELLK